MEMGKNPCLVDGSLVVHAIWLMAKGSLSLFTGCGQAAVGQR